MPSQVKRDEGLPRYLLHAAPSIKKKQVKHAGNVSTSGAAPKADPVAFAPLQATGEEAPTIAFAPLQATGPGVWFADKPVPEMTDEEICNALY